MVRLLIKLTTPEVLNKVDNILFNHLPGLHNVLLPLPRMQPGILDFKASGFDTLENNNLCIAHIINMLMSCVLRVGSAPGVIQIWLFQSRL